MKLDMKTHKFLNVLENVFVGEKIEGEGGYVNLLKVKSEYFRKKVKPELEKLIEEKTKEFPEFKEELLDKLYDFFHRYLNETGTPLMGLTPYYSSIYDRIYDDTDVKLYWKTSRHYYIKSDRILKNLEIEIQGFKIFFDVSALEYKKSNEKKSLIYKFGDYNKEERRLILKVYYREGNRLTKVNDIRKEIKKRIGAKRYTQDIPSEETIVKAIKDFEKQGKVDYFICKDAKTFLREQFDLWMYQYVYGLIGHKDTAVWSEKRIKQLQVLKEIAYRVIDWVSMFENELLRIWLKPRFVFNSNYVITFSKIENRKRGIELIEKILSHPNIDKQIKEWKDLGIVESNFNKEEVLVEDLVGKRVNPKYKFLPIDTAYFKDLELDLLSLFENLDDELDGWLIKSENFQALNTILPKFKDKVQTIYIDPPFNKEQDADYDYIVEYKDSTWITMLENRVRLGRELLNERGSIFVRCDYNGNMYVRLLLNEIFGKENFKNEIVVSRVSKQDPKARKFNSATDSLYFFTKSDNFKFIPLFKKMSKAKSERWHAMDSQGQGRALYIFGHLFEPPKGRHWTFGQEKIKQMEKEGKIRLICKNCNYVHTSGAWKGCPNCGNIENVRVEYLLPPTEKKQIDSNWTDISGYTSNWHFQTENSEILLKRVIESTSEVGDLILDFFLGSGTTVAVAHKLRRKWIGIEMGEHFWTIVLQRMKKVLAYDKSGISKDKDVREKYNKEKAGGFFKYFELEQYEEILRTIKYNDIKESQENFPEEYLFAVDTKLLKSVDEENNELLFNPEKLYPDKEIDLAETVSYLRGKKINKITKDYVEFEDSSRVYIKEGKVSLYEVAPALWWR